MFPVGRYLGPRRFAYISHLQFTIGGASATFPSGYANSVKWTKDQVPLPCYKIVTQ